MAFRVEIRKKEAKEKGLRDQHYAVVQAAPHAFTPEIERFLFRHGLNRLGIQNGVETWSIPPSIAAPPIYLVSLIEKRWGLRSDKKTLEMRDAATREHVPADGLERFLGRGASTDAGDLALTVQSGRDVFIANCSETNKARIDFLEGAGWIPVPKVSDVLRQRYGERPYMTRDPLIAANLSPFMTKAAADRQKELFALFSRNIKLSQSQDPPEDFNVPAPEGQAYLPFQQGGIHMVSRSGKGGLIADDMGLGKAQPLDAKILTPNGWRHMGDIRVGDLVIGSNGRPTRVTGVYPQGLKDIFRVVFSDGASTECCDEHLWAVNTPVRKRRGNASRVLPLSQIRHDLVDAAGNRKHYIPMVQPVELVEKDLPIDPYLMGVLLGDGALKYHYTRFSKVDMEIVEQVEKCLPDDLHISSIGTCDFGIASKHAGCPNPVRRALNDLGLKGKGSDDKFIPESYLLGSVPQRIALLQGLLDTDGYISKDGTIQFSSNSKDLVAGFSFLVMSLGGNARKSKKVSASGKDHHIVTVAFPDSIEPFRLSRKSNRHCARKKYSPTRGIASVTRIGKKLAQCISVDAEDHLYVTDDFIVTHNTIQGIGVVNARPEVKRVLVTCQANMRLKWVDEINKWKINQDLTVGHAEGNEWPDTDVVVINYDIVGRHEENIRSVNWDIVLTDEAHNLKNEETIRTTTMLGTLPLDLDDEDYVPPVPLADKGQLVHLTGTPKPNRLSEMWPLLSSSRPDLWGRGPRARQIFLDRYEPPVLIKKKFSDKKSGREWTRIIPLPGKPRRELELQMRLRGSGSFIRRLKRDTPGLPDKFRTPIRMPYALTADEQKELASINADFAGLMEGIASRMARDITPGQTRMAGALIDVIDGLPPNAPEFHEIARVRKNLGVLKAPMSARFIIDELDEDMELPEEMRRKTVVFAHHKEVIDIIERMIEARYPGSVCRYDGKVSSAKKREKLVQDFQTKKNKRVFLMSLSGATGITLTSSARMRVVEPDWSPSNMSQIEDRIWRIGQEENCDIGYLIVPNSLDLSIGAALVRKMETDERALNGISLRGMKPRAKVEQKSDDAPDGFIDMSERPAASAKETDNPQQLRLI